jgi:hypothetical protein
VLVLRKTRGQLALAGCESRFADLRQRSGVHPERAVYSAARLAQPRFGSFASVAAPRRLIGVQSEAVNVLSPSDPRVPGRRRGLTEAQQLQARFDSEADLPEIASKRVCLRTSRLLLPAWLVTHGEKCGRRRHAYCDADGDQGDYPKHGLCLP